MHEENTTTLTTAADGATGQPANKLTKWLIIVIVALLAVIIIAGWLVNDKRNNYNTVITEKEATIRHLQQEMLQRDSVTKILVAQQLQLAADWQKKAAKIPAVKIKYEKIKDSLRLLPPDEQLLFLSERIARARREGHF